MTSRHLIDPETLMLLDLLPAIEYGDETLGELRRLFNGDNPALPRPTPVIEPQRRTVPGLDGAPEVPIMVFDPPGRAHRAAILHMHGGGMVVGTTDSSAAINASLALELGVMVVSVEYRLSPETPFPGPHEDCQAVFEWLVDQADALDIAPDKIAVYGESAGGYLAAALCQMLRDKGRPQPCAQVLIYPMLDHRTGSAEHPGLDNTGEFVWTRPSNRYSWKAVKGGYNLDDRAGWYAPMLATDLSNLPPMYIAVGALDLFVGENLDYANRLIAAGVPVELHVYPGGIHGFDRVPTAKVAQGFRADLTAAFIRLLLPPSDDPASRVD